MFYAAGRPGKMEGLLCGPAMRGWADCYCASGVFRACSVRGRWNGPF